MYRARWQLAVAAVLLALLATLGALQYRWLGELSAADRERMKASLQAHAADFTTAFNAEITRTYAAFQVDDARLAAAPVATLAAAYQRWQENAPAPGLIRDIFLLARPPDSAVEELRRLHPGQQQLVPAAWPGELVAWRDRTEPVASHTGSHDGTKWSMPVRDALDPDVPALMVTILRPRSEPDGSRMYAGSDLPTPGSVVIVVLDRDQLQRELIAPLVTRHFGAGPQAAYVARIVRRDQPSTAVYTSDPAAPLGDSRSAEAATTLFELRMDDLARLVDRRPRDRRDRLAITVVRRKGDADGPVGETRNIWFGGAGPRAWELRVWHRAGPLDAIVNQSRRRNLAISLGVLGLLGASVVMVIAGARRQHHLSRQQLEFVAAVSHELRTPLAVICSAGENLADGVAAEAAQVRTYGALIGTEGRRLTSMVERVMAFAGMSSGRAVFARTTVNISTVISDAVREVERESPDHAARVSVRQIDARLSVNGDRDALRSAVQNIVGNAVKYSAAGGEVVVSAEADGPLLRIRVVDHGIGIDQADIAHLFTPFYRGRLAIASQIRGSGIGLSVVRHVVAAHRGRVVVGSEPGFGTTVTVELPLEAAASPIASTSSVSSLSVTR